MSDIVLHHYNESPYAEKIRALLGYKGLSWRSVMVPRMAPKPDMVALTGGYRKVPVLQIGADVFCDTRLIAWELERVAPSPAAKMGAGWNDVVEHWVDLNLFGKAVAYTFGKNVDHLPDDFLADRAALRGAPLDREALKRAVPLAEQELAINVAWVESGLGAQPFVNGSAPGSGDFTLYSTLWFARNGRFDFSRFPATAAWMERMKAFGHGERIDMTAGEAIALAAAHAPAAFTYDSVSPDACGLSLGQRVSVAPELLGHGTSVQGELVGINAQRLTLVLHSERAGQVHIHFPRLGYRIREVKPS
ncbi:glutathione S-transferase family protein [Aquabacterium sp.]|uniref:glutathione S-transferase family protein n=1 Tax=Aquabacterium sp. TaxID=1872578 RepID=UPI00248762AD|nr:glutathione S-transferase family protein [Aquabacterium sp.]MDI1258932.1 glutathione S-transferase family protein [Aquabacterium sp.]